MTILEILVSLVCLVAGALAVLMFWSWNRLVHGGEK
jgi:Tfp pilus assembly protein PilV